MSDSLCRSVVQPIARRLTAAGSGIGSSITYLSRLMTTSTTTPYYSGTTNIVDVASTGDYREIQPGRCLDFDETTQSINLIDQNINIPFVDGTYSVWFYADVGSVEKFIDQNTGGRIGFGTVAGVTTLGMYCTIGGSTSKADAYVPLKWHHCVWVLENQTRALYVNGELLQTFAAGYPTTFTGGRIGAIYNDTGNHFDGKLFDLRFYTRALTAAEITALYRQGLQPDAVVAGQPDATNLVGRWLLDDNSQTTSYDSSGNGNHGTIVGYASGMLYEGDDVPYSQQNLVGYSEGTSSTFVPRDESDPGNDVLGNPLDYTGTAPKYATPVDAPCLTFDGTTQYVDCGDAFTFYSATGDKPFRIASRVNIDASGATRPIISKYSDIKAGDRQFTFELDSSARLRLIVYDDGSTTDWLMWTSQSSLSVNTDYLLEASYDGNASANSVKLYINGELENVTFVNSDNYVAMAECTESITVGSRSKDNVEYSSVFDGKIWDVKVYGDSDGINLIFWTPFSEGDGNTVYDVVNGNSYTITSYVSTMWDNTQDQFFYSFENGYRVDSGVAIPALADGSAAADGNPLTGLPGLLNSDTYNLNLLPQPDAPYQRSAIPGATFDGVGDYVDVGAVLPGGDESTDNPFHCKVTFLVTDGVMQDLISNGSEIPPVGWRLRQDSDRKISFRVYDLLGENQESITTDDALTDATWYDVELIYAGGGSSGMAIKINGDEVATTAGSQGSYTAMHNVDEHYVGAFAPFDNNFDSFCSTKIASAELVGHYKYDFRENNGLVIPDRSGNGNDGTLVVNSSLSQIFAPTPFETAYTLGDGRTRPHYVTVDGPNEKDFRTEII
jgi:hypothetical protein